jgi:ATP-dependent Clp protease ATP-binding subunit ClpB
MSLFSRIPTQTVDTDLPFLRGIDFDAYAKKIAPLSQDLQQAARATTERVANDDAAAKNADNGAPVRLVGQAESLNKLRMTLAASDVNNVWLNGARGIGKTSLVESFLRLRAERRLSTAMMAKPFYLLDVSSFFKLPREEWVRRFDEAMHVIAAHRGLVIIDHFDDFVRMADGEAGRLVNTLVSALENDAALQAIILSEADHRDAILEASTGIERRFQPLDLKKEMDAAEVKRVLLAHFRVLERQHNVDFTEEAADEIIRLLERYPGRAFNDVRPKNAVRFADSVGTFVRLNQYAEPPAVAALRDQVAALADRLAILSPSNDAERAQSDALKSELAEKCAAYAREDTAWRERFAPLFAAQNNLSKLEEQLPALQKKEQRTPEEDQVYHELKKAHKKTLATIEALERDLSPMPPRVTTAHVRQVFSLESGVPLANLSEDRLLRLKQLDAELDSQIYLQSDAKRALAKAYRERELGVSDPTRPAGILMFTGGTGLGKTELVKVLARFDGGNGAEPVILRLSEFKGETATKKLLGADPGYAGYDAGSPFLDPIEKNSRAIVLLDEADKADPSVFDVLMQVLEEGKITNAQGRLIDFKDTIIVIATNALTADMLAPVDRADQEKIREKLVHATTRASGAPLFRPEFLARIDEIVVFQNLGKPEAIKILKKVLANLNRDYADRGLTLTMDDATAEAVIDKYYVPATGGRGPRMIVKEHVRPLMAAYLQNRLLADRAEPETLRLVLDDDRAIRLESAPTRPEAAPVAPTRACAL